VYEKPVQKKNQEIVDMEDEVTEESSSGAKEEAFQKEGERPPFKEKGQVIACGKVQACKEVVAI
jgi:hypothetical protein